MWESLVNFQDISNKRGSTISAQNIPGKERLDVIMNYITGANLKTLF
jgi:hypothetical protein